MQLSYVVSGPAGIVNSLGTEFKLRWKQNHFEDLVELKC